MWVGGAHPASSGGLRAARSRLRRRPRVHTPRCRPAPPHLQSAGQNAPGNSDGAAKAAAAPDDYFLEPLLRSFLLGVGAGALVETGHVLLKFMGVAVASGPAVLDALPNAVSDFAPLFVWDHVAAL
jgi:hypothetical protein